VKGCSCPATFADVRYGVHGEYRVPREAACDVEDRRLYHQDLACRRFDDDTELSALQLATELAAVNHALAWPPARSTPAARDWLRARRAELQARLRMDREHRRPVLGASARPALDAKDAVWARALGVEVEDAGSQRDGGDVSGVTRRPD
jgi:hypothetical protein